MTSTKNNFLLLLLIIGFIFQSCSKDEELSELENQLVNNTTNTNQNNGNQNDGTIISNVANIDNQVAVRWTSLLLQLERYATGMRPNASARALAYINLAAYETAVPGMTDYISNDDRLQGFRIRNNQQPDVINFEIALNATYAKVLDHFLLNIPNNLRAQIGTLENSMENTLSQGFSDRVVEDSKEWGEYVANQVIEYSQSDDEAEKQILQPQPTSYEPPTGDGFWTYSAEPERALFPYWESVRTFVINPDETTTVDPIEYSEDPNSPYFAEMMEVYTENNSAKANDDEQLWIAEFWSDDVEGIMFSPPARQIAIASQLVEQNDLDLEQTLALMVKLSFSLNDAAVATWKYKYEHMVMRPNVFIHEFIDPDYQTNLFRLVFWPNPSFPGYPSGHSCFASAAAGVFIDFFGNSINFTDRSHEGRTEFRGTPRSFSSFTDMAEENGYSRIPLGVHIRMDCTEGLRLGYEISDAVNQLDLKREAN